MNETYFLLKKYKTVLTFAGSLALTMLSVWVLISDITELIFIPIIGIVFFSVTGVLDLIQILSSRPGLVISDEGITDNTGLINAGLIRWENITGVSVKEVRNQKLLVLEINNAEEMLARQRGIKKWIMRTNNEVTGSPVNISSNRLKCDVEELHKIIRLRLREMDNG